MKYYGRIRENGELISDNYFFRIIAKKLFMFFQGGTGIITDNQVRKLKRYLSQRKTLEVSAARSGMDEKTARKYRELDQLPAFPRR
jgi:hypothetical protein